LPEPVGPRDQDDAVGPVDEIVHQPEVALGEAEIFQAEEHARLVEDTHDDPLEPAARRDRGDADVDALARDLEGDAAVLREALLRDVERRHDLHARGDRRHELLRGALGDVELAVDPVAHDDVALLRLDVDVARALADGLGEEAVDPRDDGRVVVGVDDVDEVVLLRGVVALEGAALVFLLLPDAVDRVEAALRGGHRHLHGLAEDGADVVDRRRVEGVGDDAIDRVVVLGGGARCGVAWRT
jgi:hypothetical protein